MKLMLRSWLLPLHRWSGMSFGVVLLLMAITGAGIVFRPQLEPVLNRELLTAASCTDVKTVDEFAAAARSARPQAVLDYIRMIRTSPAEGRMHAVMIRYTDQNFVYLHPCTAQVLGQRHRYGGALGTIEQVHRWRFVESGDLVTGSTAFVAALVLALVGGILAVALKVKPSVFRLKPGLRGIPRTLDLHKTVGIYASLFVLAMALTGLPQAFDWYRKGLYSITGSTAPKGPKQVAVAEGSQRRSMEELWQQGMTWVPNFSDALMHFPEEDKSAVDMYAIPADAPHANARTLMWFDPYTGKTLKHISYADSSAGFKLYFWTLSWHTGKLGGAPVRLLMLVGALSVPFLFYTGVASYFRRRKLRLQGASQAAPGPSAAGRTMTERA